MTSIHNDVLPSEQVRLDHFRSSQTGVVHVAPDSPLVEAVTLMMLNDFSQVAVLNGPRTLKGAVSWRSVAKAGGATASSKLSVKDAMESASSYPVTERLSDVLPYIVENDYVFTKSNDGKVAGIVTVADVCR